MDCDGLRNTFTSNTCALITSDDDRIGAAACIFLLITSADEKGTYRKIGSRRGVAIPTCSVQLYPKDGESRRKAAKDTKRQESDVFRHLLLAKDRRKSDRTR